MFTTQPETCELILRNRYSKRPNTWGASMESAHVQRGDYYEAGVVYADDDVLQQRAALMEQYASQQRERKLRQPQEQPLPSRPHRRSTGVPRPVDGADTDVAAAPPMVSRPHSDVRHKHGHRITTIRPTEPGFLNHSVPLMPPTLIHQPPSFPEQQAALMRHREEHDERFVDQHMERSSASASARRNGRERMGHDRDPEEAVTATPRGQRSAREDGNTPGELPPAPEPQRSSRSSYSGRRLRRPPRPAAPEAFYEPHEVVPVQLDPAAARSGKEDPSPAAIPPGCPCRAHMTRLTPSRMLTLITALPLVVAASGVAAFSWWDLLPANPFAVAAEGDDDAPETAWTSLLKAVDEDEVTQPTLEGGMAFQAAREALHALSRPVAGTPMRHSHEENAKLLSHLEQRGRVSSCWKRALRALQEDCAAVKADDDVRSRLALAMALCELQADGKTAASWKCDPVVNVRDCLQHLPGSLYLIYVQYRLHTDALCFYIQEEVFQERTEAAVETLLHSSRRAVQAMLALGTTSAALEASILAVREQQRQSREEAAQMNADLGGIRQTQLAFADQLRAATDDVLRSVEVAGAAVVRLQDQLAASAQAAAMAAQELAEQAARHHVSVTTYATRLHDLLTQVHLMQETMSEKVLSFYDAARYVLLALGVVVTTCPKPSSRARLPAMMLIALALLLRCTVALSGLHLPVLSGALASPSAYFATVCFGCTAVVGGAAWTYRSALAIERQMVREELRGALGQLSLGPHDETLDLLRDVLEWGMAAGPAAWQAPLAEPHIASTGVGYGAMQKAATALPPCHSAMTTDAADGPGLLPSTADAGSWLESPPLPSVTSATAPQRQSATAKPKVRRGR